MEDADTQLKLLLQEILSNESAVFAINKALESCRPSLVKSLRYSAQRGEAVNSAYIEGSLNQLDKTLGLLKHWAGEVKVHRE